MKQKIIIADKHAIFRTGTARVIAIEEDLRIVGQCDDLCRLEKAAARVTNAIVIFGACLFPDIKTLTRSAAAVHSQVIAILEIGESSHPYLQAGVQGVLYRDASNAELVQCIRAVARGEVYLQKAFVSGRNAFESDMVSERVRERLSPKELSIIGLLLKGYKNREIARELHNSEQVIKNYLRSIFDKTGVSDRLELALFAMHHRLLAESAMQANKPDATDVPRPAAVA